MRSPVNERQMESLLASVDPRIKSVRLDAMASKPFIVVDVGLTNRVPLSQAGQGIYRLVDIFSELLGTKPQLCFVDEIENGIHYTALTSVWKGIAEVAEDSIYVRHDRRGLGLGRQLLAELVDRGARAGHHSVVALIAADQVASVRLHEAAGFARGGRLREVGFKLGRWIDVDFMQRPLP